MQRFDLKDSPFYILDVSPRSDRGSLAEAVDKALDSGQFDETTVNRAQQLLMATKPRLAAKSHGLWASPQPEFALSLSERCQVARLRGQRSPVHQRGLDSGTEAGRPVLPTAAVLEEGRGTVRRVSRGVRAGRVRRVRVQACVVAGRGDLFPPARTQSRPLRGRQRKAVDACREITADYGYFRLRDQGTRLAISSAGPRLFRSGRGTAGMCMSISSTRSLGRVLNAGAC